MGGGGTSGSGTAGAVGSAGAGLGHNENGGLLCLKDWRSSATCNASSCVNDMQSNCASALDCCASGPPAGYAPCTRSTTGICALPPPAHALDVLDCLCK